ncbi:hypothetical protein PVAP13_8KG196802 [Panicum virgatum]|nr:hypothetical protein PVAP13_8KG196802 [Panicum virgatum]
MGRRTTCRPSRTLNLARLLPQMHAAALNPARRRRRRLGREGAAHAQGEGGGGASCAPGCGGSDLVPSSPTAPPLRVPPAFLLPAGAAVPSSLRAPPPSSSLPTLQPPPPSARAAAPSSMMSRCCMSGGRNPMAVPRPDAIQWQMCDGLIFLPAGYFACPWEEGHGRTTVPCSWPPSPTELGTAATSSSGTQPWCSMK